MSIAWRIPAERRSQDHRNQNLRFRDRTWNQTRRLTSTWRLLRNRIRSGERFETFILDSVCPGTQLQNEELVCPSQDLKGPPFRQTQSQQRLEQQGFEQQRKLGDGEEAAPVLKGQTELSSEIMKE